MDEDAFLVALQALRADRVQGASELARQGLGILAESALGMAAGDVPELCRQLRARAGQLRQARPSMSPLEHLMQCWSEGLEEVASEDDLAVARRIAAERATELVERSRQAVAGVVAVAAAAIGAGKTLLTHSLSSTVVGVLRALAGQGVRVILSESRPLNEGYRLARLLSELGVPSRLITDAQIGLAVAEADLVLVGADSLFPDGSLVNKVGTYLLALAAHDQGVPFWVCCERFKHRADPLLPQQLERMDPAELGAPALPGVQIENPYFDITPSRLISAWIDELGVRRAAP